MAQSLVTALFGFLFWHKTTHPAARIRKAQPTFRIWRIEIWPSLRFYGRGHVYHLHHWMYLPLILLVSIPLDNHILDSSWLRSFITGGAIQGFLINRKSRRIKYAYPLERSDEYR